MAEFAYDEKTGIGMMPSWEEHHFDSIEEYVIAYRAEEDEIIDEMARLEEERVIDYPEDWVA